MILSLVYLYNYTANRALLQVIFVNSLENRDIICYNCFEIIFGDNKMIDKYFMPDLYLDDIYGITVKYLKDHGIKAVLLDIDNTLVTYDDPKPTESVLNWLKMLSENGIAAAFVSNNHKERVELFNSDLGLFAAWDSKKPSGKYYIAAMKHLGVEKENAAVIGDQVFTDVWSAKRLGLHAILVKPIKDKTSLFFKSKRALEKPILKRYMKKQGAKND